MRKILSFLLPAFLLLVGTDAWGDKVTTISGIEAGVRYYIGATNSGTDYYLQMPATSNNRGPAVTDKTEATVFIFETTATTNVYKIKIADTNNYLATMSSTNGNMTFGTTAAQYTASNASGKIRLSNNSRSIEKNTANAYFGSYAQTQTDLWLEEASSVKSPTFSPVAGTYNVSQNVTITCETAGVDIKYSTDNGSHWNDYSGAITVDETTTIKAKAVLGTDESLVVSATYTLKQKTPSNWPAAGQYVGAQKIVLTAEDGEATIYYTTDGTAPSSSSTTYTSPILISENTTIKAIASKSNWISSEVLTASYTIVSEIPATGYNKVTADLGTDWAGDYLIAYSSTIFADGRVGGKDDNGSIGKSGTSVNPTTNLVGNVVSGSWGDTYNVTLEEISSGSNTYLLKTKDGKYNYQTSNANGLTATSTRSTAEAYPISVEFTSANDIKLKLGGNATGAVLRYNTSDAIFRYYKNGGQSAVYLYKKESSRKYDLNVYATGWASLYLPFAVTIPSGIKAYIAGTPSENQMVLTEVSTTLPKNTAVVVKGTPNTTYTFIETDDVDAVTSNALQGVATATSVGVNTTYVLATGDENSCTFRPYTNEGNSGNVTLAAYKAYLPASAAAAPSVYFIIDEENHATDIQKIEDEDMVVKIFQNGQILILRDGVTYDVMGRIVR